MSAKIKNIITVCLVSAFLFGFSAWGIFAPKASYSVSERRPLAAFPTLSTKLVLNGEFMSGFEDYSLDAFPLRDSFRTLKAVTVFYAFRQMDNNNIYINDGYASKLDYPINSQSIEYALSRFRYVYDTYMADTDVNVYFSVIPDKNYFMAGQNGYPSIDYELFLDKFRDGTDYAEFIDIFGLLELSDYYRTDTHWRQEKITDVARQLALSMGTALTADYTVNKADTQFYGVYYGQSALPLPAEDIYYLNNEILNNCRVYDYETDSYTEVYALDKAAGNDPYEMFLSGSKSLLVIENPAASSEKELIIFRDSFGSSITPLLAEGYSKITLVDIRYLSPQLLGRFIDFTNQDVLFLYSTLVLNNSETIK